MQEAQHTHLLCGHSSLKLVPHLMWEITQTLQEVAWQSTPTDWFPWMISVCSLRFKVLLNGNRGIWAERVQGSHVLNLHNIQHRDSWACCPRSCIFIGSGFVASWKGWQLLERAVTHLCGWQVLPQDDRSHCPSLRRCLSAVCVRDYSTQWNEKNNQNHS